MTTPIQIRREDAVRDLRELSARRGQSITDLVAELAQRALEQEKRLASLAQSDGVATTVARFQAAVRAQKGRPLTDDDLYDENGLPR